MAVRMPSFCSRRICGGTSTLSLPFGPCTSTLPPVELIFTPAGTGIGLRPIRDICPILYFPTRSISPARVSRLPNFTKNFAADVRFAGGAAGHEALRRSQNADAQAADNRLDFRGAEIITLAGTRNALQATDDTAAIRRVLQENAQGLAGLVFVDHFVSGDVALFLEDTGNLRLELGHRHVNALVLGRRGVAQAGEKIGNGIGLHKYPIWLLPA